MEVERGVAEVKCDEGGLATEVEYGGSMAEHSLMFFK